jgi:hypothetical protein
MGKLESIANCESVDIPPEAARKSGSDRRSFAEAIVAVVGLPGPAWCENEGEMSIGGLKSI